MLAHNFRRPRKYHQTNTGQVKSDLIDKEKQYGSPSKHISKVDWFNTRSSATIINKCYQEMIFQIFTQKIEVGDSKTLFFKNCLFQNFTLRPRTVK